MIRSFVHSRSANAPVQQEFLSKRVLVSKDLADDIAGEIEQKVKTDTHGKVNE